MFKIYHQHDRIMCDHSLLERSWDLSHSTVHIEHDTIIPYVNTFLVKNNDIITLAIKTNEDNTSEIRIILPDINEPIPMNLNNNDLKTLIVSEYSYPLRLSLQLAHKPPVLTLQYGSQLVLQHYNTNKFDTIELEDYAMLTLTKNSILSINNLKLSNSSIVELEPTAELNISDREGYHLHLESQGSILKFDGALYDTLRNTLHNMFNMFSIEHAHSIDITHSKDNIELLSGDNIIAASSV